MSTDENTHSYGIGDASYQAAGELKGISALVDAFYEAMDILPSAKKIRAMHPSDLTQARHKLSYFLSGWLGGPKLFAENYGPINIPRAHKHLLIDTEERDTWILCMQHAIEQQPYTDDFKVYLIAQLRIPAERIRLASDQARNP